MTPMCISDACCYSFAWEVVYYFRTPILFVVVSMCGVYEHEGGITPLKLHLHSHYAITWHDIICYTVL